MFHGSCVQGRAVIVPCFEGALEGTPTPTPSFPSRLKSLVPAEWHTERVFSEYCKVTADLGEICLEITAAVNYRLPAVHMHPCPVKHRTVSVKR